MFEWIVERDVMIPTRNGVQRRGSPCLNPPHRSAIPAPGWGSRRRWGGWPASIAFSDWEAGIGFGYVMNQMSMTPGNPRSTGLLSAIRVVLG